MSKWSSRPFSSFDHNFVSKSKPTCTCHVYMSSITSTLTWLLRIWLQVAYKQWGLSPHRFLQRTVTFCPSGQNILLILARVHTRTHKYMHIQIHKHEHTQVSKIKILCHSASECNEDSSGIHIPHPTFLAGLVDLRKLNSSFVRKAYRRHSYELWLGHVLSNCGTLTTTGTPTAVCWYVNLIKKSTHKKDKRLK
jgi:hypothetical protein